MELDFAKLEEKNYSIYMIHYFKDNLILGDCLENVFGHITLIYHNDQEAMPVGKKSASNETVPIFKLTHLWCKNHWETNI